MPCTEEVVSHEAAILCNEYIQHKLRQMGLVRKGRTVLPAVRSASTTTPPAHQLTAAAGKHNKPEAGSGPSIYETVAELRLASAELERLYPGLFRDVFPQLNVPRVPSAEVAGEVFAGVADEMFRAGVTWARVAAVFAVAGQLAAECVQQRDHDHAAFVERLTDGLTRFVRERLAGWIADQGGWSDMAKTFHGTKEEEDDSYMLMAIGVLGALCGLAGTIIATGKLQESL